MQADLPALGISQKSESIPDASDNSTSVIDTNRSIFSHVMGVTPADIIVGSYSHREKSLCVCVTLALAVQSRDIASSAILPDTIDVELWR